MEEVTVTFKEKSHPYEVIKEPFPHITVSSHKTLHGWWHGKRECTAERLLINPYNGCFHNCFMCYSHAFMWGYFQLYRTKKIITVCKNFDKAIAYQLDTLSIAACGYLSPVTDPFQPINKVYHLSEKIIKEFVTRNLPIEFITKGVVSKEVVNLLKLQKHSFGQVSILTLDQKLHKLISPNAAPVNTLFNNLTLLAKEGIHSVCRIDPIIPYLTDKKENLKELITRAKEAGASHIIASCMDIPLSIHREIIQFLSKFNGTITYDYGKLYTETIDAYLHAKLYYRRKLFSFLRETCDKKNLSFALCMEFKLLKDQSVGLNKEFASAINCEGIDIPIYVRRADKFYPIADCKGNCLNCKKPICGLKELALGKVKGKFKGLKISDYRHWSKELRQPKLF